ncbi:16S rRNA (cytidine(1402)-2'-O)-methyltransferase [Aquibacillus kalidii]|uniref:16S rRNA (cytidine(1402)-2'-O)-methyltransferase n=1 Tax=Aquibacillus kalidii TaxID=2762597 RepID=UPI001648AC36|nr:16S rRNA (cytidine(1402)-2'-O)-methyltransferase [Aquibacillus kalidii]
MKIQSSFQNNSKNGTLYIVPTPIGNLEDITIRSLNVLKSVEWIAAEDTRNTRKLLNHFEIEKSLVSYHEHNKLARETRMLDVLQEGKDIALVSDAGMPGISDPGYELIRAAIDEDITVVVLPGANAALCALVGSGLSTNEFYFYGFLPRKKKDRDNDVQRLKNIEASVLFYESPHRLRETLAYLLEQFGDRNVSIARELTKRYEEYIRGTLSELIEWTETGTVKGEFCIVMEGNSDPISEQSLWWSHLDIIQHVDHYIKEEQFNSKQAIKRVSEERQIPKREVYQTYHVEQ